MYSFGVLLLDVLTPWGTAACRRRDGVEAVRDGETGKMEKLYLNCSIMVARIDQSAHFFESSQL